MKITLKANVSFLAIALISFSMTSCKKSTGKPDPVPQTAPIADFGYTGKQQAPADILFTSNSLHTKSYSWDFGNGTQSSKAQPGKVVYDNPGSYDVILTVANDYKKVLIKKTIVITKDTKPEAHFSFSYKDDKNYAPATILFNNESVNADSYEWEINGAISREKNPVNVVFNAAGDYKVRLTAVKFGIRSAVFEQVVPVSANANPHAYFVLNYHPYPYKVGELIQLVDRSRNCTGWKWSFEEGLPAESNEQYPTVKFNTPGDHKISLVTTKDNLVSSPWTVTLRINP